MSTRPATSTIAVDGAGPAPDVTPLGRRDETREARTPSGPAGLPLAISVGVNAAFFVAWWVPEYFRFPGHQALAAQLAPLASGLVTQGQALAAPNVGRSTLLPTLLLLAAIALPRCARSHRWGVRVVGTSAACYLGAITWVVTLLGLLVRGALGSAWLGMLLLTVWVAAAGTTAWRAVRARSEDLPDRPRGTVWLVLVIAALHPLPIALGRAVFSPDLTAAARTLATADPSVRLSALVSSASVAAYAAGVCGILVVWACSELVPPLRPLQVPWVRRSEPREPLMPRLLIAALAVAALALSGGAASQLGHARAQEISAGGPAAVLPQVCAAWSGPADPSPATSLIVTGGGCGRLASWAGWHRGTEVELKGSLAPLTVSTPGGHEITTKVVGAQYGAVVVLATSGRIDRAVDQLSAVRIADGAIRWTFRCDDDQGMAVRFAGADGGDALAAGRFTERGEVASVVVACQFQKAAINPRTGKSLRG